MTKAPFIAAAVTAALLAPFPSSAQTVNCHDPENGTVETRYASQCRGVVVSDEEAAAIRQKIVERRRRALMSPAPSPADPALKRIGSGTGFFVNAKADVLTNRHVVDGCSAVTVETTTGQTVKARFAGADKNQDLALLQTDVKSPAFAVFSAKSPEVGQEIAVIGYPDHGMQAIRPVVVSGRMSRPALAHGELLGFQADIRPGNSGGPVLDKGGRVLGVVFAKINSVKIYEKTGNLIRNVGFAISNRTVLRFLKDRDVEIDRAEGGGRIDIESLERSAAPFVVRVGCWR